MSKKKAFIVFIFALLLLLPFKVMMDNNVFQYLRFDLFKADFLIGDNNVTQKTRCFSKQFMVNMLDQSRADPSSENKDFLIKTLPSLTDNVNFFLDHGSEDEVYDAFRNAVLSISCVQVPDNYVFPVLLLKPLSELSATPEITREIPATPEINQELPATPEITQKQL